MKKCLGSLLFISLLSFVSGCTQQENAKNFGGTATLELPVNQKLVLVTWKENQLWYLVRPMKVDEKPETYEFREGSSYGVMEGKVILIEQKK